MFQAIKVVINLKEREDRRSGMEDQLRRVGWEASFFPAIRPNSAEGFPSIGARGCFLSHLEVLKQAEDSDRHLILMEDDLNFSGDFCQRWPQVIHELDQADWSLFYPAHERRPHRNGLATVAASDALMRAHMVVFNKNCVGTIVAALETILRRPMGHPAGGLMHVDGAYSTIRAQRPELLTFCSSPPLGYQRSSRSDIRQQTFLEKFPGVEQLRNVKRWIQPLLRP